MCHDKEITVEIEVQNRKDFNSWTQLKKNSVTAENKSFQTAKKETNLLIILF